MKQICYLIALFITTNNNTFSIQLSKGIWWFVKRSFHNRTEQSFDSHQCKMWWRKYWKFPNKAFKWDQWLNIVLYLLHFAHTTETGGVFFPVLRFVWFVWARGLMRMRHGVPEIEMNDDLNFSAMAHSDKQLSRQISTIVFWNASEKTLLIKLGNSALYLLFGSYRKTERIPFLAPCLFSKVAGAPVCFHAESTGASLDSWNKRILTDLFRMPVSLLR